MKLRAHLLKEQRILSVYKSKVLRRTYGFKSQEVKMTEKITQ